MPIMQAVNSVPRSCYLFFLMDDNNNNNNSIHITYGIFDHHF